MLTLRATARRSVRRLQHISSAHDQKYAILIDADNVPPRLAGAILDEVSRSIKGSAVDRRVYGDFSQPRIESWKIAALEYGIETKMQASPSKAKNATDIALCIDAMDILHSRDSIVDTFVIVTNDGDFAPLAQRLRRSGKRVVAVGTGASLIASCDSYVALDFSRKPTPRLHTAADVALLEEIMYDLSYGSDGARCDDDEALRGGHDGQHDDLEGQQQHESATQEAEVHVNALANEVDRLRPGWRRKRMQDFINFRHLLESEPYRSSLHTYTHPTQHAVVVQLRPQAREAVRAARDKQELAERQARAAVVAKAKAADPAQEQQLSWTGRLKQWVFGENSVSAPTTPAAAASASIAASSIPATDIKFMTDEVAKLASRMRAEEGREGWVHVNDIAVAIDKGAVSTGRGGGWRIALQNNKGGFRGLLQSVAIEPHLEMRSVRKNDTHVDWYARLKSSRPNAVSTGA